MIRQNVYGGDTECLIVIGMDLVPIRFVCFSRTLTVGARRAVPAEGMGPCPGSGADRVCPSAPLIHRMGINDKIDIDEKT